MRANFKMQVLLRIYTYIYIPIRINNKLQKIDDNIQKQQARAGIKMRPPAVFP